MTSPIKVTSVAQLRALIDQGFHDYTVVLSGGVFRSSRYITTVEDGFLVWHSVSDCTEIYTDEELMHSFIGDAMTAGSFYQY